MMGDAIEEACERYGLNQMIEKKKKSIPEVLLHAARALECFHGLASHPDVLKKLIREIISIAPEVVKLYTYDLPKELREDIINRVVEKIYNIAEDELLKIKAVEPYHVEKR